MANHGFITSRFHFKKDEVEKYLHEINQRKFKGLLKIEDSEWATDAWFISYDDTLIYKHPVGFNIWIESKRKLEHRHTHGWGFYLEVVFSSELGFIYDGMISDECCEERWKPTPKKYGPLPRQGKIVFRGTVVSAPQEQLSVSNTSAYSEENNNQKLFTH